jgi:hypothetical protein
VPTNRRSARSRETRAEPNTARCVTPGDVAGAERALLSTPAPSPSAAAVARKRRAGLRGGSDAVRPRLLAGSWQAIGSKQKCPSKAEPVSPVGSTSSADGRSQTSQITKEQPRWQRIRRSPGLLLSHPERVVSGVCFATNRGARTLAAGACSDAPAVVSSDRQSGRALLAPNDRPSRRALTSAFVALRSPPRPGLRARFRAKQALAIARAEEGCVAKRKPRSAADAE